MCVCVGVGKGDVCVNKLKICSGLDKTAVLNALMRLATALKRVYTK